MIEIHLVRLKPSAAVLARHPPKVAEELERRALARHHPIDLALPISTVVAHVVWTLIACVPHLADHEHAFEPRQ